MCMFLSHIHAHTQTYTCMFLSHIHALVGNVASSVVKYVSPQGIASTMEESHPQGLWGYMPPNMGPEYLLMLVIPICVAWRMDLAFHSRKETQCSIEKWANIDWANNLVHISSKKATF